jgi:hypothetical protein
MARFIAVHNVPGITEADFRDKLDAVKKWRPDRRTTILKVYADTSRGKLFTECEAVEQSHFEDWMKMAGWPADEICQVDLIFQTGDMWRV